MKRIREEFYEPVSKHTRSKKPKLLPPYEPPARNVFSVTGTDVRNYMIRDSLVDWLKFNKSKNGNKQKSSFVEFIMQRGNDFERELVDYIRENKFPVVTVANTITRTSCNETIRLMKEGVPIIHSAPFRNNKKHIRGIIDLLVRSDYMHLITDENPLLPEFATKKAGKLNGNYHYIVIDVKFSTLPLRADGIHLLNSGNYPAYKSQLWIYTQGIGEIQGYTSRYAYILGRRWGYTSKGERFSSLKCLDKLGVIDYEGVDYEYKQKTLDAMNWLRDLRRHGKKWSVDPPTRPELYPNMCIDSGEWNNEKKEIANKIGDITQIWYCGIKHRQNAIARGIMSWRDKRCCSKTIGMNGVRAPIIDKIIEINRQNVDKIRPKIIKNNLYDWKVPCNEIFVDFETFCDIFSTFDQLPEQPKTDKLFMIGVYYLDSSGWKYRNFTAKAATNDEEYRIMDEFVKFVREQGNPRLWYWHADESIWARCENRQMDLAYENKNIEKTDHIVDNWRLDDWVDLCRVFREEPIVVKDCFRFGLKEIASAMYKHGLIKTRIESNCHSGMDAAIKAWKVYQTSSCPTEHPDIKDIAKYNLFDVSVLQDILFYLRKNLAK